MYAAIGYRASILSRTSSRLVVSLKNCVHVPKLVACRRPERICHRQWLDTSFGSVMSLTVAPSLHRFVPRRALETTSFGYEVVASVQCVDDCVATVQWIDCWCPDAAQFILVEASTDLRADTCDALVRAIGESHLRPKIRLVCKFPSLDDTELLAILHRYEIGFLFSADEQREFGPLAERGILGVCADAATALRSGKKGSQCGARQLVRKAHDLGLRSIASQIPTLEDVRNLLALGFDYVSQSTEGFIPTEPSFAWQGRVV